MGVPFNHKISFSLRVIIAVMILLFKVPLKKCQKRMKKLTWAPSFVVYKAVCTIWLWKTVVENTKKKKNDQMIDWLMHNPQALLSSKYINMTLFKVSVKSQRLFYQNNAVNILVAITKVHIYVKNPLTVDCNFSRIISVINV